MTNFVSVRAIRRIVAGVVVIACAAVPLAAVHAEELSPEEARTIEYGKEIFKTKATCQFCHKWDASGDQGYGGNALSLRKTQLTPAQMAEVIKCGRPGTAMPYHDKFAYTDKRCYKMTREDLGKDMPQAATESLQPREVDAVVKYLFAKAVGRGESTYEECIDFWGSDTRECEPMKNTNVKDSKKK
jgi:mono/diheme cytochrome c family protein